MAQPSPARVAALFRQSSATVALVTVHGGKEYDYDREEIVEMIEDYGSYKMADNLPKWLYVAGKLDNVRGFPRSERDVLALLAKIRDARRPVKINVRSDDRSVNEIKF